MDISIVICTYNRAQSLKRTLNSIEAMRSPGGLLWEVIIVDNNSTDDTRFEVERFRADTGLNMIYVLEELRGLSHARNRGIKEAVGEIIAFTDDDVIVDENWLVRIAEDFKAGSAACVGGKILPSWEKTPPPWLRKELYGYIALLDLGDSYTRLALPTLFGANFAFKSSVFKQYGNFNMAIGRTPLKLYGGEDTEYIDLLLKNEERIYYDPDMIVHHCISEERMRKAYFKKWAYDQGELNGMMLGKQPLWRNTRIILYYIKNLMKGFGKFLWFQIMRPSHAFKEQLMITFYVVLMIRLLTTKLAQVLPLVRKA